MQCPGVKNAILQVFWRSLTFSPDKRFSDGKSHFFILKLETIHPLTFCENQKRTRTTKERLGLVVFCQNIWIESKPTCLLSVSRHGYFSRNPLSEPILGGFCKKFSKVRCQIFDFFVKYTPIGLELSKILNADAGTNVTDFSKSRFLPGQKCKEYHSFQFISQLEFVSISSKVTQGKYSFWSFK